jgi:hypothetical protein
VARRHPDDVKELLEAGAALRQTQRKVLSGVRAGGFREAMERRRQVVNRLTKAAEKVLRESGHASAGAAEAVTATLEAASLDDEAADQFRAGRLSKELPAPAGFGGAAGLELVPAERKEERPAKPSKVREAAAREAKELSAAAAQARRRAIKARDEADRLEAKAERLKQEVEETRTAAREASKKAREAESDADRAQSEADRATARLD